MRCMYRRQDIWRQRVSCGTSETGCVEVVKLLLLRFGKKEGRGKELGLEAELMGHTGRPCETASKGALRRGMIVAGCSRTKLQWRC